MAKREAGAAHESDGSEATVGRIRPAAEAAAGPKKKRGITGRLVLVALLGAAAWFGGNAGYAWWTDGRFLVTTDDAYVAADITTLAAKASGYVTEVMVADNQAVKKGDVLARVDSGD